MLDFFICFVLRQLENTSLTWRSHHCRLCNHRPMLDNYGLGAGRDLYRAIPATTRDLGFPVSPKELLQIPTNNKY